MSRPEASAELSYRARMHRTVPRFATRQFTLALVRYIIADVHEQGLATPVPHGSTRGGHMEIGKSGCAKEIRRLEMFPDVLIEDIL